MKLKSVFLAPAGRADRMLIKLRRPLEFYINHRGLLFLPVPNEASRPIGKRGWKFFVQSFWRLSVWKRPEMFPMSVANKLVPVTARKRFGLIIFLKTASPTTVSKKAGGILKKLCSATLTPSLMPCLKV